MRKNYVNRLTILRQLAYNADVDSSNEPAVRILRGSDCKENSFSHGKEWCGSARYGLARRS